MARLAALVFTSPLMCARPDSETSMKESPQVIRAPVPGPGSLTVPVAPSTPGTSKVSEKRP